ncbi:MAG: lipoprotein insertase outer membrane protein LolB [Colwellia sp.]
MFRFYKTLFSLPNLRPNPLVLFTLFFFVLSGCSSVTNKAKPPLIKQTSQQRITQLEQLQQWKISGKIAFIERDARNSASFSWIVNEKQKTQQLNLTTYLGIKVLQLDSRDNIHTIESDGKTYSGNDLEKLIHSITGLTLPTQALIYWLKGIPYQESDHVNYQVTSELPQTLSSYYNNELWQVSYANYQQINGYTLATAFTIKKEGLLIKIAINDWFIPNN